MIFENPNSDVVLPKTDLTSVVLEHVDELGDKIALIDGTTGRKVSYKNLEDQINHLAAGLNRIGFKKGDVCAVFCPNTPEYATIFLAVAKVGGINTTVNSLYPKNDLIHQFNDSNSSSGFIFEISLL